MGQPRETQPDYSPDGLHLAISRAVGSTFDIVRLDLASSSELQLTAAAPGEVANAPRWSTDGEWVLYVWTDSGGHGSLRRVSFSTPWEMFNSKRSPAAATSHAGVPSM